MSDDDYLWNPRSRGPRDPWVERLERTLGARQLAPRRPRIRPLVVLPLVAAVVVLGLLGWQVFSGTTPSNATNDPQPAFTAEGAARPGPDEPAVGTAPAVDEPAGAIAEVPVVDADAGELASATPGGAGDASAADAGTLEGSSNAAEAPTTDLEAVAEPTLPVTAEDGSPVTGR